MIAFQDHPFPGLTVHQARRAAYRERRSNLWLPK